MRLWRLVLDAGQDVWTFTVASTDPFVALELAKNVLPRGSGAGATLEELEALYDPAPSRAGVVQAWRGGVEVTPAAPKKATRRASRKKVVKAATPVGPGRARRTRKTG